MAPKGKKGGPASRNKKPSTSTTRPDRSESSAHSRGSSSLSPLKPALQGNDGLAEDGDGLPEIDVDDESLMKLLEETEGLGYDQNAGQGEGMDMGQYADPSLSRGENGMQVEGGMDMDIDIDTSAAMALDPSMFFGQNDMAGAQGYPEYSQGMELEGSAPEGEENNEDGEDEDGEDDEDDDDEEEGDEEEEDEEGDDDDDDDEEEEDDGDEEGNESVAHPEEEEDDAADEEEDDDDDSTAGTTSFRYPASVPDFSALPDRERRFKIGRFVACTLVNCKCPGLQPPRGSEIVRVSREQMAMEGGYRGIGMTGEGWWSHCGECGHGWEGEQGHVWPKGLAESEKARRGRVMGRIEEFLDVSLFMIRREDHE